MITLQEDDCRIMYSENIPYIRIDVSGLLHTAQLIERLNSPKLFVLLKEKQVKNLLLNLSQAWRVGTEDLDWIENTWLRRLSETGVRKVSIVTVTQVHEMLANIFRATEENAGTKGVEVHFFSDEQFYNGWAAVSWF